MLKLLKLKELPDASLFREWIWAMGALQILDENKLRVPDDVALVAFSNESYTSFTEPAMTTVDQHSMRMVNAAAEIFMEEVSARNKKYIPQKILLKPELIIRPSSPKKRAG